MNKTVINIEDAVVSYRENIALRGVSLKVEAGEFVGIIGPNGAGKTTLLTVVNGLGTLRSGRVWVLGNDLRAGNGHSLRKKVGYVAQVENIDPRMPMNVREVVMIGRYGVLGLFKRPSRHDWAIVDDVLELVGMSHLARRPIGHLSGGEQQRVAIARCLAQEPELFLLDEPTASLDWKAQTELLRLVRSVHDSRHLTTLFVTHDLDALPHTCDRVVLMKEGRIVSDGTPDRLISTESLSRLYDMPSPVVEEGHPHIHRRES
ncbi:MAG: ABC transporter ATP-binding protein [Chloroflexi bacterium]|nr:ABC transporter ATP-binding protein [Chloroflexota bacterium]